MNFEEEKYPTLPSYDDHSHSRDSHENIHEERQRLISAVSELDKIKAEMEARIRKEYEDKLKKEDEERKEKEAYTEFQKDFQEMDLPSKRIIDHVVKVMNEIPVFVHVKKMEGGTTLRIPSLIFCITTTNIYHVRSAYIYPLYKFNKKLSLEDCKFLICLLKGLNLEPNSIIDQYLNYYIQYNQNMNLEEKFSIENFENIFKLFPGKYDYDGWEKIDNLVICRYSIFYNKKEMKTASTNPPVWIKIL